MSTDIQEFVVETGKGESVTAMLYRASKRRGATVILGHGAGADQLSPFMQLFASGLADRGLEVLTFNFVYMQQRRSIPDRNDKLEACYRAVIEFASTCSELRNNLLVIGGKSMGGRIASQVAARAEPSLRKEPSALVFFGYPLHPPGKPEKRRDEHLKNIKSPMLFVQGSRDAFGRPEELQPVIESIPAKATLYAIEGGDHSLKVKKSADRSQPQVYNDVMDEVVRWLTTAIPV